LGEIKIMPYLKEEDKKEIDRGKMPTNAGELNYLFTTICHNYIRYNGERYQRYNDLVGALEGCKIELYRRKIAPYEDKKIRENGDVI